MSESLPTGKVYLVGAGPGDPGLLTLRGRDCLAQADVVLYDYLANPLILAHAPSQAERICLGRHGGDRIWTQDEINARMLELAQSGKTVVRLKGGDPAVFAHVADEFEALQSAGIPYEVVPGITAALAASSYTGIPLTHADVASAVAFVTGQEREGKAASALDFTALAHFPGTLIFYMGVTTASHWTTALVLDGMHADTPAAIVLRCSLPDQEVVRCTLGTVPDELARRNARPPAIVIVGKVVKYAPARNWFASRPLLGQRVMVTRPAGQGVDLMQQLTSLGAAVVVQPAIEIGLPDDWTPVDQSIAKLDSYDWLVFSSANGVRHFLNRIWEKKGDLRALGKVKIAAIGPATADELAHYRLRADLIPTEFRAESLAAELIKQTTGQRILLVRASRGRELLADELRKAGRDVEQVVAYNNTDVERPEPQVVELLRSGQIDWITVTSSSIARSLVRMFGEELRQAKLASISPVTSAVLRESGFEPNAEAAVYTTEGVVEAILSRAGPAGGS